MMEEKSSGLSESQEKEKLAVPLSRRKNILYAGADDLDKSREIKLEEIDPKKLLEKAQLVRLSDSNKKNYVVIKFSYVLYDVAAGKVGLFSREDVNHHFEKAKHSLLLSSGLEQFYGAIYSGKKIVLNAYHPFTQKIGAYVNCFWLPFVSYREFPFPVRFNALAFRKKEGRHYAFYIHYAVLKPNSLFPRRPFELHYPGFRPVKDKFLGFYSLAQAEKKLKGSTLEADKFALRLLLGKEDHYTVSSDHFFGRGFHKGSISSTSEGVISL